MGLAGARVLVWGLGRHGGGLAAARLCAAEGAQVEILDAKPAESCGEDGRAALAAGFVCHVGDASHPAFLAADLIVPSPAIPPRAWPASHPPIASPEALAFARHRGQRVAVTGTKGKSTTARILGAALGWRVAGNSYRPLAEAVLDDPDSPLVCELSSFQLWYLRGAAPRFDATVLTLLATDHLDWHPDIQHYRAAKLALLGWTERCAVAPQALAAIPSGTPLLPPVTLRDGSFVAPDGQVLARRDDLPVPGPHNGANACLALAVALGLGAPAAELPDRLRTATPLPHRLATVHRANGLAFVDDSIATTPEAAIAALASFDGPLAVILGGSDKGADFAELAAIVAQRGALPVLLGATAPRIASALHAHGLVAPVARSMTEAVELAAQQLDGTGTVLLSPACASFDLFRGFDHRGDCFTDAARARRS